MVVDGTVSRGRKPLVGDVQGVPAGLRQAESGRT
jgi:hypothetical protein